MNSNYKILHEQALAIAKDYHKIESKLVGVLGRIDETKAFRALGYASLFDYVVSALGFSRDCACCFINVARKAREIPQINEEIKKGHLTVAKAKKITAVINKDNAPKWLEMARTLPCRKLEHEVAKVAPKESTVEKANYVSENRLDLRLGVSQDLLDDLRRIQDILSQKKGRHVKLEEVLEVTTEAFLGREDPVIKAKRILARNEKADARKRSSHVTTSKGKAKEKHIIAKAPTKFDNKTSFASTKTAPQSRRKALSAAVKYRVIARDEGQCSYRHANGARCDQRRWLEIDHVRPVALGGVDQVDNLQLLCFSHHRQKHMFQ